MHRVFDKVNIIAIVAGISMATPAIAAPGYFQPFHEPHYLVEVAPLGGKGVIEWRLVPESQRYDTPDGVQSSILGGPYGKRMDVELDRNRLSQENHSVNLVPVRISDGNGNVVDSFRLGAKPALANPSRKPLSGSTEADFSPAEPNFFPLPFTYESYIEVYRRPQYSTLSHTGIDFNTLD